MCCPRPAPTASRPAQVRCPPEPSLHGLAIGLVALLALGLSGLIPAILCLGLAFFAFRLLCLQQIGGQTGDTIGAMQQIGEIAALIVAATILY